MGRIPNPIPIQSGDLYSLIKDFPNQVREALSLGTEIIIRDPIDRIIIAGMGASGSAGDILNSILWEDPLPIHVVKAMSLPFFAQKNSLVVCISYSGDTNETVSLYTDATKKKCKIIVITSGGKLARMATQDGIPLILIPRGLLPRQAYGYFVFCLLTILARSHLTQNHLQSFESLITLLEHHPYESSSQILGKKLAGTIPVIYTTPRLEGVGKHWKISLNENAKILAFTNILPEACHNELCGYEQLKVPIHAILLHDDRDSLALKKRIDAFKQIIRKHGHGVTDIELKGVSHLLKIVSACHLGDYASYYVGESRGVDPFRSRLIDEYQELVQRAEGT